MMDMSVDDGPCRLEEDLIDTQPIVPTASESKRTFDAHTFSLLAAQEPPFIILQERRGVPQKQMNAEL